MNKEKSKVEELVEKVFRVDCDKLDRHFKGTKDRTVWYKVNRAERTMYTPGRDVLRINPQELTNFIGAAEVFINSTLDAPEFDWDNLNLSWYNTADAMRPFLEELASYQGNKRIVAVDIETRNLGWDKNKLLSLGFATSESSCVALSNIPVTMFPLLEKALNNPDIIYAWHNGKFDCTRLKYICNINARIDEDTMLKHYVQVSEVKSTHGLKQLGPVYLQAPKWDDELDAYKKKWCREHRVKVADFEYDMIPTEILIPYMQRDCIATYRLLGVFDKIKEPGTDWIYRKLIEASNVFVRLELNGVTLDMQATKQLEKELREELAVAAEQVRDGVEYFWNPMEYAKSTGAKLVEEFNLNSPKQLLWLLQKATNKPIASTDAATIKALMEHADEYPEHTRNLLEGIAKTRKASKYLDTYVVAMQKQVCGDGKIRGSYLLHGTETGRLSSNSPNMQNLSKEVKPIFCASKGYKLVQLDYSQCIAKGTRVNGVPIEQHSNAVYKGVSIVGTITTKRGYTVVCTPDHKILTDTGWKEVSKLTEQDYIALQSEDTDCVDQSALYRFEGFWVGDGAFNGSNVAISVARKGKYEGGVRTIITAAGFKVGYESETSLGVKCGNTKYVKYLLERYNKKCLRIPEDLEYYENRSKLAGFLGGLFDADGTVVTSTISVATAQYQFAQDIQRCLLYFGVMSTITKEHGGYNFVEGGKDYWRVQISDSYSVNQFNNLIGFSLQEKREKAHKATRSRSYGNVLPTLTVEEVRESGANYRKYVFNYLHGRKYTRAKVQDLRINRQHFKYQWDSFKSYEVTDYAQVYDLIEEPENRFAANGIIVHNCELRVLGVLSGDRFLIDSYKHDKDLHSNVAEKIFGKDFTSEHRRMAKTVNFGIAYGRGASAISEAFGMPKSAAQKIIDDWFDAMPMVRKYISGQRASARRGERQQTMFGRVRHYVINDSNMYHIENEYINTPIQSIASDLTLFSLIEIDKWLRDTGIDARIIMTVHDSIVLEVRDNPELVVSVARKCQEIMRDAPIKYIKDCPVPFKADAEAGYSYGHLEEI